MRHPYRLTAALAAFLLVASAFTPRLAEAPTPSQQLFMLKEVQPDLQRIGLIWDGSLGDDALVESAHRAATSYGVELLLARVEATRDVGPAFRELSRTHAIDALWILTDEGLTTREPSRSFLLREAARAGIPVLGPGADWVRDGAALAVLESADGVRLIVNRPVAEALSLQVPEQYVAVTEFLASR